MKWTVVLVFLLSGFQAFSQGKATVEFKADGCCGMCADRIEEALDVSGVRMAKWDREEKVVFVAYKPKKISIEALEKLVADAGHDTENFVANDAAYGALVGCCQYRDGCPGCSGSQGGAKCKDGDEAP